MAQNNLGVMYEDGRGVAKDYAQAVLWYRRAADQGYAPAHKNLANAETRNAARSSPMERQDGQQSPITRPTAAGPAQTGAETGRPTSADDFHAAIAAERSGNYAEAMLLFRRIDAGQDIPVHSPGAATYQDTLTETRTSIGEMYETGLGVPQDYKAARYWYQKALDTGGAGLSLPSGRLARLYEQGLGGPKDHQKYLQLDPVQIVKQKDEEERRKMDALMSGLAAAAAAQRQRPSQPASQVDVPESQKPGTIEHGLCKWWYSGHPGFSAMACGWP